MAEPTLTPEEKLAGWFQESADRAAGKAPPAPAAVSAAPQTWQETPEEGLARCFEESGKRAREREQEQQAKDLE